jgi:hypothetical protein
MCFFVICFAEEIIEQESEFNNKEEEALKFKSQKLFPALSTAIKILYTPERGRYGVAARDIQVTLLSFIYQTG